MIEGRCHCGAVRFRYHRPLDSVTDCNCSICRRLHALWAYGEPGEIEILAAGGATRSYAWGDRMLAFHSCATCGCTTHHAPIAEGYTRMAVNMRLAEPAALEGVRVRRFDGAKTWTELD